MQADGGERSALEHREDIRDLGGVGVEQVLTPDVDPILRIQLGIEYAPHPPLDSGTPERADASVVAAPREAAAARQSERESAVEEASARLAGG